MKKNIKVFLICMVAVLALTALTACDSKETPTNPTVCTHQGGEATCLEPAVCALCGEFYGEAKGHSYGQWTVKTAATCEVAGEETRTCSCGAVETREIAATGHSFSEWAVKTAATCEAAGEETRTCSCGAVETREIAATGHSFSEWAVKTAATCEAAGEETRSCTCGAVETREIAATGHSFGEWAVLTEATCEAAGEETRSCSCGKAEQREIAALGHDYEATYVWSEDYQTCTASATCKRDEAHTTSETAKIRVVTLNVTAEKVTYVYEAAFENDGLEAQTKSVDGTMEAENGLVTVVAPAISGLVPSHDYVKFSFRGGETSHSFTVYYSEVDVWDGKTVSTSLSGSGTAGDPYLIQSGADLAYLKSLVDAAGSYKDNPCAGQYFKLTKSIDLNGANFMIGSHSAWNNYQGFAGIFDGNNCSIRGLNIQTTGKNNAALFGCVKEGAVVKNLIVYGSVSSEQTAGAIVAYLKGTLENVTNYASVTGKNTVGGVAANAEAKKTVSTGLVNYGSVTSTSWNTGGIAGSLSFSISDATNWGTVTSAGDKNTGGIGGACHKDRPGTLTNCANYGIINNNGKPAGHIAGVKNGHTYVNCDESHDLIKVEAKETSCAGDGNIEYHLCTVCQGNFDAEGNALTVDVTIPALSHVFGDWVTILMPTCETTGVAKRECECGGYQVRGIPAWGHNYGEATYAWSEDGFSCTASVTCPNGTPHPIEETATIVASLQVSADKVTCTYKAVFENDYFTTQTGETEELTATVENGMMKVFAPAIPGLVPSHDYVIFDFHNEEATYTFDIYYSKVDVWDGESVSASLSGSGTAEDPYLIQSAADFAYFAGQINAVEGAAGVNYKVHTFKGQYFKLTKSIDLNGHDLMIGYHKAWNDYQCFAGIFDGNNCSIRGVNIARTDSSAALFGCVQKGAVIKNLSVYGNVSGNTTVGGVVAYQLGKVDNVTSYVTVTATGGTIGGVVANQEGSADALTNCVNYGNVTSTSYIVGGVVGSGGATVTGCVNWGNVVAGSETVGGIAGTTKDKGTIENCVNYGSVKTTATDKGMIGGIVGKCLKPISDCVNYGTISGVNTTGGIAGSCNSAITNCYNYGEVNGTSWLIGGIAGSADANVKDCTNYGDITSTGDCVGGIVGAAKALISNCQNYGTIKGTGRSGGIAYYSSATIDTCVNHGDVIGGWDLGGILAWVGDGVSATITGCTNNGNITGTWNNGGIFGLAHDNAGTVTITGCTNNGKVHSYTGGQISIANKAVITECTENGSYVVRHELTHVDAKDATCTEAGNVAYDNCSVCGKNFDAEGNELKSVAVNALGHTTVIDEAVEATCTKTGLTEGKHCSVCKEVLVAQNIVDALGHTEGEAVRENEVAATCTEVGSYDSVVYCSVCKTELSREAKTIEKLPHKDENGDGRCDACNASICTKHTEVIDEAVEATCTKTGLTEGKHCSVCGDVIVAQEEVEALGHAYEIAYAWSADNATCTASEICARDASHIRNVETATVSTIDLSVSATKVTYTYHVAFANSLYTAQTKVVEGEVALENSIATINAPAIAGRVASHDYVKFGFHDEAAAYTFTIYYSEVDVWDGTSVSESLEGFGTEEDPYLIQSAADFAYLANQINTEASANQELFKDTYFKMTKSINLNEKELYVGTSSNWSSAMASFRGYLDGNNCTIRGLKQTKFLFGIVQHGYIKNLSLYGEITNSEAGTGVIGYLFNAHIENITNYATVSGQGNVGGIVGNMQQGAGKTSTNLVNYGNVTGTNNVGGIAGLLGGGITNSVNWGTITRTAGTGVGGIAASCNWDASIANCTNYGDVNGTGASNGGIAGKVITAKTVTITNCVNNGTVTGAGGGTGGIFGENAGTGKATIKSCTNNGDVIATGKWGVGGIMGFSVNTADVISNCVNNGSVTSAGQLGGIVGKLYGNVSNCTNKGEVKGTSDHVGGIVGYLYTAEYADAIKSSNQNEGSVTSTKTTSKTVHDIIGREP